MQEQRNKITFRLFILRITPAHAGTTSLFVSLRVSFQDHPCACRNNPCRILGKATYVGSPLRMQEQPFKKGKRKRVQGITPAHAGTTAFFESCIYLAEDHPCACRNNMKKYREKNSIWGSPLRMQEQPLIANLGFPIARITPAHAGTTENVEIILTRRRDHPCACRNNAHYIHCMKFR